MNQFQAGVKDNLYSTASKIGFVPTQPPIQLVPQTLSARVKRLEREADHSPPTSTEGLYLHYPICLHGVTLNLLNTGTTLPFTRLLGKCKSFIFMYNEL
jgi:hypothetical protein